MKGLSKILSQDTQIPFPGQKNYPTLQFDILSEISDYDETEFETEDLLADSDEEEKQQLALKK